MPHWIILQTITPHSSSNYRYRKKACTQVGEMKSFFIWLIAVIIGGASGYGSSFLIDLNMYIAVGLGIILGSTAGITINIHRDRDDELPDEEIPAESESDSNADAGKPEKINQKAS